MKAAAAVGRGLHATPIASREPCTYRGCSARCCSRLPACIALREVPESFFDEANAGFRVKRDYVLGELAKLPGITCPKPEGAFYVFPVISSYFGASSPSGTVMADSNDICVYILAEAQVALVPGVALGDGNCLRICYATSMEVLEKAMARIVGAFTQLTRPS